ncbi:V-type proton ATPase 116 kDa subunit a 1-like [Anthonomus grandis grandis]|uniref:V-type proton ATPase 116 kDa subunit a 1-like n=1 Tax=Anthonomus grandis grandis TaxID=2921223 RepID=UPI0021658436|nr:V-type proton ATPase 116 kDa subunit a 1-like [Anthonomus grandis grandis]
MGSLLRGEDMVLIQMYIQPESAYLITAHLGESGCVQFIDLNPEVNSFQREHAYQIKRISEMERELRYIESEIKKRNIRIFDIVDIPTAPNPRELGDLEAYIEKTALDIRELTTAATTLKMEYYQKVLEKNVLLKAQLFFSQQEEAIYNEYTPEEMRNASQLGFIGGVIAKDKFFSFERLMWRIGRGNIFVRQADINELITDPTTEKESPYTAFVVFFQGEQLDAKINKVCAGYKATTIEIPVTPTVRNERINRISAEVQDIKVVINQTEDHIGRLLFAVAKDIQNWSIVVCKMKAIYDTLNMFSADVSKKCIIAEGWVPVNDLPKVQHALDLGSGAYGSSVHSFYNVLNTKQTPPTYNRTNKFTQGFQNLISAYAFGTYGELNPALYTIVTFPFLFAIMFGDLGHGIIMAAFGAWLVIDEKKIDAQKNKNEIFGIFFSGRYIILMMGLFSMYTGLIYNDIFSRSMNIFGSKWKVDQTDLIAQGINVSVLQTDDSTLKAMLVPKNSYDGEPYYMGLDPAWQDADNKIIFLNSLKMKLSIIIGVIHMIFGVVLSVVNFMHFKKPMHILLDFLPKILFFSFLFVYMVIMIFMKWLNYSGMNDNTEDIAHSSGCAPNVLIYFIGMMLFKAADEKENCNQYLFEGQEMLQHVLVVLALVCIPWMLLGAPLYENFAKKKKTPQSTNQNGHAGHHDSETPATSALSEEEEHDEPFSELMVHAGIHTIEFTLSTVSHTASYLRLWALSLAHAQLSEVLWTMVFRRALVTLSIPYYGGIIIFVIFAVWAAITVAILVLMEGLSAFLHTLRLHWVEFMTKFFDGQGYEFEPFSFKRIFEQEEEAARE